MSVDLEKIRNCLLAEPLDGHFVQEEGGEGLPLTPAAVLFPIVLREGGETVLLTQRTAHLRDHAGQISFPGGRVEDVDLSPIHTFHAECRGLVWRARCSVDVVAVFVGACQSGGLNHF
jgi:hypothetical protein